MAWNLQFPLAQFLTKTTKIEVSLETRLQANVTVRQPIEQETDIPPLLSLEIIPSEMDLPINIDFPACGDAYARESDLIAVYPQEYPWPFGYQVDFRYRSGCPSAVEALELWLSVSTSMLACQPKLHLIPKIPFRSNPQNPIAVADHGRAALIIHPLDFPDCETVACGDFSWVRQWDLFGGFMEKGVIRRARFLFAWSETDEPEATWMELLNDFARSPLPLTA
jgi:hypothetical protein